MDKETFMTSVGIAAVAVGTAVSMAVPVAKKAAWYLWIPAIVLIGGYKAGLKASDAVKGFKPFLE